MRSGCKAFAVQVASRRPTTSRQVEGRSTSNCRRVAAVVLHRAARKWSPIAPNEFRNRGTCSADLNRRINRARRAWAGVNSRLDCSVPCVDGGLRSAAHGAAQAGSSQQPVALALILSSTSCRWHVSLGCARRRRRSAVQLGPKFAHPAPMVSYVTLTPCSASSSAPSRRLRSESTARRG